MSSHTQCMTSTGDNHSRIFVKNHWGTWSHAPINCCLLICWCCSADGRFVRNLLSRDYEGIHILLSTVMKDKSNWWQWWGIVTCMKNAMAWFSHIEWLKLRLEVSTEEDFRWHFYYCLCARVCMVFDLQIDLQRSRLVNIP